MAKDHGPTIKSDQVYEDLREAGASKEKAARIANAYAGDTLDRDGTRLERRSRDQLYAQAREIGIEGRADMDKNELIQALREG